MKLANLRGKFKEAVITSFFKREVYVTYSLEELSKVREILDVEGINYSYKVKNLATDWSGSRSRDNFGSFGTNSNFERQYVILVKKKDFEQAKFLIHRGLN